MPPTRGQGAAAHTVTVRLSGIIPVRQQTTVNARKEAENLASKPLPDVFGTFLRVPQAPKYQRH